MTLFQMQCFAAVAENLSFARAAEQLHVTQPAVTQQIHALERELGVRLLNRSTRSVKLTEEGKVFLQDARQVVEISERARKRFENPDSRKIRPLTLGCYSFTGMFYLSGILKKLAELYPDLHPRLKMTSARHLYRYLEEGDTDAVIGFREIEEFKIPAVYQEMKKMRIVCVCEKNHRFAGRESVSVQDLKEEKLILFTPDLLPPSIGQMQGRLVGGRPLPELHFCESAEAAVILVQAGLGVCVMPELFVPENAPLLRTPMEEIEPISFGIYYRSLRGNEVLRTFVRLLRTEGGQTT
ncbi:MAG TPA: LysR family transcriptional regulator [Candidatus Eisenbergiella merdavium]|uniref:LysR family transcriptional regulator n=1 Tax=Candidatus Eisenbergiella merdavium TaxID=2838551 RepID=A0A9D2SR52_9FIRM|nr:LysR family transcriptional regulator [Candidatus Eisenbergiella merdavium]